MKKILILIGIIITSFILFLVVLYKPKNYKINYNFKNYEIEEIFNKNNNGYTFIIKYNSIDYPLYVKNNYIRKRKLITDIRVIEDEKNVCLTVNVIKDNYIVCSINNYLTVLDNMPDDYQEKYFEKNKELSEKIVSYNKTEIYNNSFDYLLWNYKGFDRITKNQTEELKIFNKDNYKNNLAYQTEEYLIFPNYDDEYYFQKMYVYNVKNNVLNDINFDEEISYESYYVGEYKNKLYLFDKKNKAEYEINLKKNIINNISKDELGLYYNGKSFEKVPINKFLTQQLQFKEDKLLNYFVNESKLYLEINNYKILIDNHVKSIIHNLDDTVFYLKEDRLYYYKYNKRSQLLLKNSEWNFNYQNQIFIFN